MAALILVESTSHQDANTQFLPSLFSIGYSMQVLIIYSRDLYYFLPQGVLNHAKSAQQIRDIWIMIINIGCLPIWTPFVGNVFQLLCCSFFRLSDQENLKQVYKQHRRVLHSRYFGVNLIWIPQVIIINKLMLQTH